MKTNEKALALELRLKGKSLKEISKTLGVAKSTASLWVKSVTSQDMTKEIFERTHIGHPQTAQTREKLSQIAKKRWTPGKSLQGNSSHRQGELRAKPIIEARFQTLFTTPQEIEGIWFDFVNSFFIIEYTTDATAGITNAIRRFQNIKEDPRVKILIAPAHWFGIDRRKKLEAAGAIFVPLWF